MELDLISKELCQTNILMRTLQAMEIRVKV
jgi:hypothetical protein